MYLQPAAAADLAPITGRVGRPPVLFRLARWMIRLKIPSGWRLWRILKDCGALDLTVLYRLEGTARAAPLYVPLYRGESSWSEAEIKLYSHALVNTAVRRIAEIGLGAVLFDCGADIGMVASALIRQSSLVNRVVAFEPNAEPFGPLARSAALWPVPARAVMAAVGARSGHGRLQAPSPDHNQHAFFIAEDDSGPVEIRRIDDEPVDEGAVVVLKIDVEGAEHAVVMGAMETLSRAPDFVVVLEAHPAVAERNGFDPSTTIRLLRSIRPIAIDVAEFPDVTIDPDKPYFAQLGARRGVITNIVCSTSRRMAPHTPHG